MSQKDGGKSNEFGHSAEILMWLEVPVRGVLDNRVTLGDGKQVLVTVIDGKEFRSEGHFLGTRDLDAGLADMAIKELQGQLAEATVEIEALSKALCDGNDELLRRRKELDEARRSGWLRTGTSVMLEVELKEMKRERDEAMRLAAEEKELRQQAHGAIHEARRLAEEWRDYAKAWRGSAYSASFMKKPAELPWEWGSQKRRLKWEEEK